MGRGFILRIIALFIPLIINEVLVLSVSSLDNVNPDYLIILYQLLLSLKASPASLLPEVTLKGLNKLLNDHKDEIKMAYSADATTHARQVLLEKSSRA